MLNVQQRLSLIFGYSRNSSSAMLVVKATITRVLWNTTHGRRRSPARPLAIAAAIPHEGPCKETSLKTVCSKSYRRLDHLKCISQVPTHEASQENLYRRKTAWMHDLPKTVTWSHQTVWDEGSLKNAPTIKNISQFSTVVCAHVRH